MKEKPLYRFGLFELDLGQAELRRDGRRRPLQELPLRLLGELVERPGRLVTRQELQAVLWPEDVHVDFEGSLNAAMRRVREALGDSAADPRYVETVPKRGYRFLAPVTKVEDPGLTPPGPSGSPDPETEAERPGLETSKSPDPLMTEPIEEDSELVPRQGSFPPEVSRPWQGLLWLLMAGAFGLLIWIAAARFGSGAEAEAVLETELIAVLPLKVLGDDARLPILAAGLTEELTVRLGQASPARLRVVAAGSARRVGEGAEMAEIGRLLGVEYAVEGSLRAEGDAVRVTARLVETRDRGLLWSASFDRQLENLLELERELAEKVMEGLRRELFAGASVVASPLAAESPISREAYEHYLRGRYFMSLQTPAGYLRAEGEMRAALDREPGFANGWAGLAQVHAMIGIYDVRRPHDAFPEAEIAIRRALELDAENADARVARAMVAAAYRWRFDDAEADLRQVVTRWPSHVTARRFLGLCLAASGRHREAQEQLEKARQLDPLSLEVLATIGWSYFLADRPEEAIEATREILELEKGYLTAWDDLKWFYTVAGREAEAAEAFFHVVALEGEPEAEPYLRGVYAERGFRGLLEVSLESQLKNVAGDGYQSPYDIALTLSALGRAEDAAPWLERSFIEREVDLMTLPLDPRMKSLRSLPEFTGWLERIGAGADP